MARPSSRKKPAQGRRKPKQARSKFLVDAIMTASAQLLRELGPEATTTNLIAERAGVSVGSLYQYFPNKSALYTELARRHVARLEQDLQPVLERVATEPIPALFRGVVESLFQVATVDAPLYAALHRLSLWGQTSDVMLEFRYRAEARLGVLFMLRQADFPQPLPDPELAARIVVRAVAGLLDAAMFEEPSTVRDPRLLDETTRMISGYLLAEPAAAQGPG